MKQQSYTEEFKEEAVRQVIERGYTVADVSKRLGVSSNPPMQISILVKLLH